MNPEITLPKGVTVYVGGQKYRGKIPREICPEKYLGNDKPKGSDNPKGKTLGNGKSEGTSGK